MELIRKVSKTPACGRLFLWGYYCFCKIFFDFFKCVFANTRFIYSEKINQSKSFIKIAVIKLRAKNSFDMIAGPGSVMPRPDGKEAVFSSLDRTGVQGSRKAPTKCIRAPENACVFGKKEQIRSDEQKAHAAFVISEEICDAGKRSGRGTKKKPLLCRGFVKTSRTATWCR